MWLNDINSYVWWKDIGDEIEQILLSLFIGWIQNTHRLMLSLLFWKFHTNSLLKLYALYMYIYYHWNN
jgi:hypothetical protein